MRNASPAVSFIILELSHIILIQQFHGTSAWWNAKRVWDWRVGAVEGTEATGSGQNTEQPYFFKLEHDELQVRWINGVWTPCETTTCSPHAKFWLKALSNQTDNVTDDHSLWIESKRGLGYFAFLKMTDSPIAYSFKHIACFYLFVPSRVALYVFVLQIKLSLSNSK